MSLVRIEHSSAAKLAAVAEEALSGIRTVVAFNGFNRHHKK